MSKQLQWERKLLDLSLRNNLLNLRYTKNLIPLSIYDLSVVEDMLADGNDFVISSGEDFILKTYPDEINFSNLHEVEHLREFLESKKQLFSPMYSLALKDSIVSLYRASKSSIEENGANTLFLAMGLMSWIDPKSTDKTRYAPLVLIPIEMIRKSFMEGYIIRQREEDIMVNTTLIEMLKQDFGIKIEGLDPLPTDEHGLDLLKVFSTFEQAIQKQPDWQVLPSACLGIFSFSQFVMWNDLRTRSQELAKNKIVKSLMDGKLSWQAEPMATGEKILNRQALVPIPTDASQLFAIESATDNRSFVLHGPPGTGKSQTITGIIANALAQGKTVLFVAEKMAALSVVQKRMERLGLGSFCLELHSNKAKKKDVLAQLLQAAQATSNHNPQDYLKFAEQAAQMRKDVDHYAESLHKIRSSHFSFYEMMNRYQSLTSFPCIELGESYVLSVTKEAYQNHLLSIQEFCAMTKALGDVTTDPLRWIARSNYTPDLKQMLLLPSQKYVESAQSLQSSIRSLQPPFPINSIADAERLNLLLEAFEQWNHIPDSWSNLDKGDLDKLDELLKYSQQIQQSKEELLQNWREDFLSQDAHSMRQEWEEQNKKGLIGRFFGQHKMVKEISAFSYKKMDKSAIEHALSLLEELQKTQGQFTDLYQRYQTYLPLNEKDPDWQKISVCLPQAMASYETLQSLEDAHSIRKSWNLQGIRFADLRQILQSFLQHRRPMEDLTGIHPLQSDNYLQEQIDFGQALQSKSDYIREWMQYNAKREELEKLGLSSVAQASHQIHADQLVVAYEHGLFKQLISHILSEDEVLKNFSGVSFNEKIAQFAALNKELEEQTKKEIFYRLASRVPNFTKEASQNSELGILQRAFRSNARGLSIRKLFGQIPSLLPRLCPCMLMSPISCAQYLDVDHAPFDLVVFDEASQLSTSKAVGVLARGKEAIIVGDPNQMPPTSFFSNMALDEENLQEEDLESILDDCLALSMPQTHLLWHYRSRHESLIAFSNHAFYENKLYTFPSANDQERMVRLVESKGVFERGGSRTNPIEAQQVVAEIIRRFEDPALRQQSLGVVTFNISQQSLIENLLEDAYAHNAELDAWANHREEALFVKNLENVQGDERDVILFSIGFGPDKEGKTYMNFGPLNQEKGWRRLNVAVTRSRKEMLVFSSLAPEDIDLSKTQSRGVAALREFLEYAQSGKLSKASFEKESFEGIALHIRQFLKEYGYEVHYQVGHSKFKIDVAVLDRNSKEQYILGIMLDGMPYKDARTTEDRELAPISVLKGLGWNIHRMWSMDYYENPQKELQKLLDCLQNAEKKTSDSTDSTNEIGSIKSPKFDTEEPKQLDSEQSQTEQPLAEPSKPIQDIVLEQPPTDAAPTIAVADGIQKIVEIPYTVAMLKEYQKTAKSFASEKNRSLIIDYIQTIVQHEAPICEEALYKKITKLFGISRPTFEVQSAFVHAANALNLKTSIAEGKVYYWREDQEEENYADVRTMPKGEKREIEQIHPKELQNSILLVLQEQIAIPSDALIKEASKKLGYARLSSAITSRLEQTIEQLILAGRVDNATAMLKLK